MGMENAFYDRKVIYLDYIEREQKVKNGGVVKWEVKNDKCRLQFHINGLYPTDTLEGELRILSDGQSFMADHIRLKFGAGDACFYWQRENLADSGISYENCEEIEIVLSKTRKLKGRVHEKSVGNIAKKATEDLDREKEEYLDRENEEDLARENEEDLVRENADDQVSENVDDLAREVQEDQVREDVESPMEEAIESPVQVSAESPEGEIIEESISDKEPELTGKPKKGPKTIARLSTNKWEQLCRFYRKITPFGDDRDYLSIEPRDFVILCGKYQELVQNSFLLHGYYNYGHVILTRIKGEEEKYYIGVPGVYYENEKQAALLFGFEGFEGGTEFLQDGAFGYYMKRVEI